ncbi:MAG: NnrS family protein [Bacteriovorax sp.]|nr:NnrS family protein [Bacteriovorax sp.]
MLSLIMLKTYLISGKKEPYRILFPMGFIYLLWATLLWLPQIWNSGTYPVLAHRYLMLNGFSASFIAGFLMTAVPKFSQTETAHSKEIIFFISITLLGLLFAFLDKENLSYAASALQAGLILFFLSRRVLKRKVNPPYSFVFIFVGLVLWIISALMGTFTVSEAFKNLHYEGAIASIILGVGSRLIPGILGHAEIIQTQRAHYESDKPFLLTVPFHFYAMIFFFVMSYFLTGPIGIAIRAVIVVCVGFFYWKLYQVPKEKTALTWNIWISCWLILASFLLKAFWQDGLIHASHAFFFCGIVLLTLLIATRVLQSHGPKDKRLENLKILYVVTILIIFAGATRVSAFLMPENYLRHLGYSSIVLSFAVILWGHRYLRFIKDL